MNFLPLRHQDLQGFQVHQRFQELRWQAFLQTGHAGPTRHAGDQVNEAKELMVGPWAKQPASPLDSWARSALTVVVWKRGTQKSHA